MEGGHSCVEAAVEEPRARPVSLESAAEVLALLRRSGRPEDCVPPECLQLASGVELDCSVVRRLEADLTRAACSAEAADLLGLLGRTSGHVGLPNERGVTAVHLAALAGDVALAEEVVSRAAELGLPREHWRDADGRTPLHMAVLHNSRELVIAFAGLCGADAVDRWGHTAAGLARALELWDAHAGLCEEPETLRETCLRRARDRLRGAGPEGLAALTRTEVQLFASTLPLHDYGLLSQVAAAYPDAVDPTRLARSASCLECRYASLANMGCTAALGRCHGLIEVWEDLASFRDTSAPRAEGAVLAEPPAGRKPPTVADRRTFVERFHRRTGCALRSIDWSNLMVIGGMVLACLTADDEEFERDYAGTDVDIYVVGLRGQRFKDRVIRLLQELPPNVKGLARYVQVTDASELALEADVGRRRLVCKGGGSQCDLHPGDFILEVDGESYEPDGSGSEGDGSDSEDTDWGDKLSAMMARLRTPRIEKNWKGQERRVPHSLKVLPASAASQVLHGVALRTPQTATVCIWDSHLQRPLPNVQVVLAPYESPAHLLYTTDIDCTAMGFDGKHLVAAPRAREAVRHRRILVRPEKYTVRGEWRTEARMLKYAARGFEVVDPGLKALGSESHPEIELVAKRAEAWPAACQHTVEARIKAVQDTGMHGALLLQLAARERGLRQLMLYEAPLLPAGLQWKEAIELVENARSAEKPQGETFEYNDGYGKARTKLAFLNPISGNRIGDGRLRGLETSADAAIVELDLESDRFEVRGWYDGIPEERLNNEHAVVDPTEWRGVGDFRSAA